MKLKRWLQGCCEETLDLLLLPVGLVPSMLIMITLYHVLNSNHWFPLLIAILWSVCVPILIKLYVRR